MKQTKTKIQTGGHDEDVGDVLLAKVLNDSSVLKLLNGANLVDMMYEVTYPNNSLLNKQHMKTKKQTRMKTRMQTIKKFTPTRKLENDAILFGFEKNPHVLNKVLNDIVYNNDLSEHPNKQFSEFNSNTTNAPNNTIIKNQDNNRNKIIYRLLNIIYETILHKMDKIKSYQMQEIYGELFVPIRHRVAVILKGISDLIVLLLKVYECNNKSHYDDFYLDKPKLYEKKSFLYNFFHKQKEHDKKNKIVFKDSILMMALELHRLVSRERAFYYEYSQIKEDRLGNRLYANKERMFAGDIKNEETPRIRPEFEGMYKYDEDDYLIIESTRQILYLLEPIFIYEDQEFNTHFKRFNRDTPNDFISLTNMSFKNYNLVEFYKIQKILNFPWKLYKLSDTNSNTKGTKIGSLRKLIQHTIRRKYTRTPIASANASSA
jgi:hypothetical protein